MKLKSSALFFLSATSIGCAVKAQQCLSAGDQFDIVDDGCDLNSFEGALDAYLATINCAHGAKTELRHIFGSESEAELQVSTICADGWSKVDTSSFNDVDNRFTNSFMNEYVAGGTFLNSKFPFNTQSILSTILFLINISD